MFNSTIIQLTSHCCISLYMTSLKYLLTLIKLGSKLHHIMGNEFSVRLRDNYCL